METKQSYDQVNCFPLESGKYLFTDCFHKNNSLFLICPVYKEVFNPLEIQINNWTIKRVIGSIFTDPVVVLVYKFKSIKRINEITVRYGQKIKKFTLVHFETQVKKSLVLTTLFKDDYRLIDLFYPYYQEQGVEHFYLYYNGKLTDSIKKKFQLSNVTLIEWNYRYYNNLNDSFRGQQHHAQLCQIYCALYKYGQGNSEYMIFNDFDEYMYVPDKKLSDLIAENNYDTYRFCNYWAETLNREIPEKFPSNFLIGNKFPYPKRAKNIHRTDSISELNIHRAKVTQKINYTFSPEYQLFHFYNWSRKNRKETVNKIFFSSRRTKVFMYWDKGYDGMPDMIKCIYNHNMNVCQKYDLELVLISDKNIRNFIEPHPRFFQLKANHKSDVVRFYLLHQYGGFWFDCDVMIIKDLNLLLSRLEQQEVILDEEYKDKIGCCSMYLKEQSVCSFFCLEYVKKTLDEKKNLEWGEIGPFTVEFLYKKHPQKVLLNSYKTTEQGCNFISWKETPGVNKEKWFFSTEQEAKERSQQLKGNSDCFYLITWTIYRLNDISGNLIDFVFYQPRSVFSYFREFSDLYVENCSENWNGRYFQDQINGKQGFKKNNSKYLYQHQNVWRLGNPGVKLYTVLPNLKISSQQTQIVRVDQKNLVETNKNTKQLHVCFCSDDKLIDFIPTVINSILHKNNIKNIFIHYIHCITDKLKIEKLRKYITKFPSLSFQDYYKTWDHSYKGLSHVSSATMLRLFIPELISAKKVLYLDIDVIVEMDLTRIFSLACGSKGICIKDSIQKDWKKSKIGTVSGNCGVMLMNLQTLRKNNFTQECLKIFLQNQTYHDQDIINVWCAGKHAKFPVHFNVFLGQDDHILSQHSDFILHFVGPKKPYYTSTGKFQWIWDQYNYEKIFSTGKKILAGKGVSYNESKHAGFTGPQPFYYFLSGAVNNLQISNVIEIGTHKAGSTLSFIYGITSEQKTDQKYKVVTNDCQEHKLAVQRLSQNPNVIRVIGSADENINMVKIKSVHDQTQGDIILFVDALKSGSWIEKIIRMYYFDRIKYIFLDDITINEEMRKWWNNFKLKVNGIDVVDYLGVKVSKNGLGFIRTGDPLFKVYIKKSVKTKYAVMWASTINIGDDIQTLAGINFLKKKGITEYTFVDREKLKDYKGPPVKLVMNGWYMHNIRQFPPAEQIEPIFISVHIANENLIVQNKNYFKKHEPIGCRDQNTVDLFQKHQIKAYFTGCLTLYFDDHKEKSSKKYLVDVNTRCDYIPNIEFDKKQFTDFVEIEHDINKTMKLPERLKLAEKLLNQYRCADLVVTTRLHCVLPCRGFNTNVIFMHKNYQHDPRFSGLRSIIRGSTKLHQNKKTDRKYVEVVRKNFNDYRIGKTKIPNIIHFVFGLKEQTEDFLFTYYLAVYSSWIVNKPEKIYFTYHYTPKGKWWQELLKIPVLTLRQVPIPTHFGEKKILHTAHRADKLRMQLLWEMGGVYMDIDTISVRPYHELLDNSCVLGLQMDPNTICNAIMFSEPHSPFFKEWLSRYEKTFNPKGWDESSIYLPYQLYKKFPHLVTVKHDSYFFNPNYGQTDKIFARNCPKIPKNLISLHLWETFSLKYFKNIKDWSWGEKNKHTLYGKIMLLLQEKYN